MKAKKSVLWLLVVIGMLLSCAATSYAAATAAPKFTTSKLEDATHGDEGSWKIEASGNTDSSDGYVDVVISNSTAETALKGYGLKISNGSKGELLLEADELTVPTPSAGYKFKVKATNQWRKKETDNWTNGSVEKEYTLKILAVEPKKFDPKDGSDLSELAAAENASYPLKDEEITDIEITVTSASPTVKLTATGLPKGLSLETSDVPSSGGPSDAVFKITGKPTETGTFKITVTATNADTKLTSKKATAKYTLTVLDTPGLDPKEFKKEATFGKAYSQTFKVTGVTKDVPLTKGEVTVGDGETDYGIKGTYSNGQFTISGTPKLDEFGEDATESVDITFTLTSPAQSDPEEIVIPLIINATAPVIADKTAPQKEAAAFKKDAEGTVSITAKGPGDITWTIDPKTPLPDGLDSEDATPADAEQTSVFEIHGTPEVTAKNYAVNLTASNGAGSVKYTLKFTIDSDPPSIEVDPPEVLTEESDYSEMVINSGDVEIILEADTGPVTWKVTNLPSGLTLTLSSDEGLPKNAKSAPRAIISGTPKAPMKAGKYITVTATDPNLNKTSEAVELKGLMVYGKPTLKTTKLPDVKIGTTYKASIKADGATEWDVDVEALTELGITVDSSDAKELVFGGQIEEIPLDDKDNRITKVEITVNAIGPGGGETGETKITVNITGDAPKFTTSSLAKKYTKEGEEENEIKIGGSQPIEAKAYITVADAKAAGITTTAPLEIGEGAENAEEYTGLYIDVESKDGVTTVTLAKKAGEGGSFKKLGVTIEADNGLTAKPVAKVYKVDMEGEAPSWAIYGNVGDEEWEEATTLEEEKLEYSFTAQSEDQVNLVFSVSGDAPITITAAPNKDTNGLKITVDDKSEEKTVTIKSTNETPAKTTKLTLTAKNGDGQSKVVVTLIGLEAPVINEPKGGYVKEVEQGKKLGLTLTTKSGTKPIRWAIDDEAGEGYLTAAELAEYGVALDEDKGKIDGATSAPTVTGEDDVYEPVKVKVYAYNDAGESEPVDVEIGIMGSKPKLASDSKAFTFTRGEGVADETTLTADGINADEMTWAVEKKGNKETIGDYVDGLTLNTDGTIEGKPTEAVKNVAVPIVMNHYGNEQKASVKITVVDPQPEFAEEAYEVDLTGVEADEKNKVSQTVTGTVEVALTEDSQATGASKITWKASKPTSNVLAVKVENAQTSDTHFNTAKVTVTLAKGKAVTVADEEVTGFTATFTLTATNSGRTEDKSNEVTVTVNVNGGSAKAVVSENDTIGETSELEDDVVTDEELSEELGEGDLTIGTERTVGMLTDKQAAILDEGRFVIAAILPEISATADGQYGLEVDLAKNVKAGAKLYWFAFPKDAADSEDDTIIDFFELDGTDTEVVPDNHVVAAYPWLREGVTYGPVIAVKAEDAESGEAVTEGELEETAEGEATSETTEVAEPTAETEE